MWAGAHTPPPTGDHWGFGDAEVGCVQHEARPWAAPATGRAWGQGQDGGTRAGTSHQTTTVTARSWACLLTFEKSCILDLERRDRNTGENSRPLPALGPHPRAATLLFQLLQFPWD